MWMKVVKMQSMIRVKNKTRYNEKGIWKLFSAKERNARQSGHTSRFFQGCVPNAMTKQLLSL